MAPGKTSLTAKGRELLPTGAGDAETPSDAFLLAADAPEVLDGVLRLGVSEVVAHSWLKPFIAAFAQALPSVRVELTVELSRDLLERMQDGELDLCFQTESRPYTRAGLYGAGSACLCLGSERGRAPADMTVSEALAHHSLFLPAKGTQPFVEFQTYLTRFGLDAPSLVPSSNLSVAQNLVRQGLGFGLLPLCMVQDDIAESGCGQWIMIGDQNLC